MSYHASEPGVRKRSCNSYRNILNPQPNQPLHTLYTGRFLSPGDHYSGDNIPHEDEEKLSQHRDVHKALYRAAKLQEEALYRHLGGRHPKVLPHPPVEPDSFTEDPSLKYINPSNAVEDNMVVGSSAIGTGSAILEEMYSPNEEKDNEKKSCGNCGDAKEYREPFVNLHQPNFLNTKLGLGCCIGIAMILVIILIVLYCVL